MKYIVSLLFVLSPLLAFLFHTILLNRFGVEIPGGIWFITSILFAAYIAWCIENAA